MHAVWMASGPLKTPIPERLAVFAILACGAAARLTWAIVRHVTPVPGESHNVAVSLARTGKFAGAFVGGGMTAHVGMLTPIPSAVIYGLLGVESPIAEYALVIWNIGLVSLGVWLCWRLACALDVPRVARVAAVALAALMPLQFDLELQGGRNWEVNLAVPLLLWILLRLVTRDRKESIGARDLAITGAISGILFIVSPPAGLASVAAIGLFQILRLRPAQWWAAPAAFVLVTGILGGLWVERNLVQLGEPIALRDNLGLELAVSNYPGAMFPADPRAAYLARLHDIHPNGGGAAIAAMRAAGGEVSYYHKLGKEAGSWMANHPSDLLYLSARHFLQFYLPPKWFWYTHGNPGKILWLRQSR